MNIINHPPLYKKKALNDANNRTTSQLMPEQKERVQIVINKFFELFITKHL
jgi:hypothetical protein